MTSTAGISGAATQRATDAAREVEAIVRASGTSFFWAMRLLPPHRRRAIFAVYAYCRDIDDIADGDWTTATKQARLQGWRDEVERVYAGTPTNPVARALQEPIARFGLPKAEFHALLDGMERDAKGGPIAPTDADLRSYCRQVAGAVGMLAIRIFAENDPNADAATLDAIAVTQGEALQLTNILRDLGDDAARGRLYLPDALLERHSAQTRDPEALLRDPAMPAVCAELAADAERRFARTHELLARVDRETARPCRLMLGVYERLLRRLKATGWRHPEQRVRVPKWQKLWVVARHGIR
jgi:phytoene synthase